MIFEIKLTLQKLFLLFILSMFMGLFSFAQQADDIIGSYHLPNDLNLQIFKEGNKYKGKIIALNEYQNGQTIDYKNPNESKQKDLLMGKVIINNLEFDAKQKHWIKGEMYGPEKGMTFNLEITKIKEGGIEIIASKYIFWKTMVWAKI